MPAYFIFTFNNQEGPVDTLGVNEERPQLVLEAGTFWGGSRRL
jgi:hypothetical protein